MKSTIKKSPIALLPLLPLCFLCNLWPDPLVIKITSGSRGGCSTDPRGDSSFVLLTQSISSWISAETPAMLLSPHSWDWLCALLAHSQCMRMIAWLPAPVPMQQDGAVPAHTSGKPISSGCTWALQMDLDWRPAGCCFCQFPSWSWPLFCNNILFLFLNSRLNWSGNELLPLSSNWQKLFTDSTCLPFRRICGGEWVSNSESSPVCGWRCLGATQCWLHLMQSPYPLSCHALPYIQTLFSECLSGPPGGKGDGDKT